jgi:circadian clock protein KaiB
MTASADSTLSQLEERLATRTETFYDLTLFVSGASDLAGRAIANARHLCETHLCGHYRLSVVDVHEDMAAMLADQVLATPTLMRNLPLPVRKVVGDLSRVAKVIQGLDLPDARPATAPAPAVPLPSVPLVEVPTVPLVDVPNASIDIEVPIATAAPVPNTPLAATSTPEIG